MNLHANAKLGLAGRRELVLAIEQGLSLKAAASAFSVSPATAHRWWHRWLEGGRVASTLLDRSSRPLHQPRRLSAAEEEPILRARRETNLGPGRLAGIVRRARSTIWKVLRRHGLSRRARGHRQSYRRYEWSRPGALLHMDVKRLARFSVPGHRVTGDPRTKDLHRGIGYDHLHCVVDDNSRIAYVELHPHEDADTNVRTLTAGARLLRRPRPRAARGGDDRQRDGLPQQSPLPSAARRPWHPPHPHTRVHTALERQSGALHPDAATGMGVQPLLADLERSRSLAPKLRPLLQPAQTAQLTRRPATPQPRSQRLWAGHLAEGHRPSAYQESGSCQLPRRFLASTRAMVASAIVTVARKIVMGHLPLPDDPAGGVGGRQGRNGAGIRIDPLRAIDPIVSRTAPSPAPNVAHASPLLRGVPAQRADRRRGESWRLTTAAGGAARARVTAREARSPPPTSLSRSSSAAPRARRPGARRPRVAESGRERRRPAEAGLLVRLVACQGVTRVISDTELLDG